MRTPTLVAFALFPLFAGPAAAGIEDDVLSKCLAQLTKTYGLRQDLYGTFHVNHITGERYEAIGQYEDASNGRKAVCHFNNGRVTLVEIK